MKKRLVIIFSILTLLVVIKYFTSEYKITYSLDNHKIITTYKDKRYYISIDDKYNFDIYKKRGISKLKIKNIKVIESDNLECLYPEIKNVNTNPLCYYNNEYIDYNLINDEVLNEYKNIQEFESNGNFYFNNNLTKKEYIYLWNYKGFYRMNRDKLETLDLFKEGKYDNSLMYKVDNKILFPNYNQEYEFNKFYVINMLNNKMNTIESKYDISYNSYIVGNIDKKVYLFDIKESCLYEIDIKRLTIRLVGSEKLGYFKYEHDKKVSVSVTEYKNKNIVYKEKNDSNYKYEIIDNKLYKSYMEKELKLKIFEGNNIRIVGEYKDNLYFISEDKFYKYSPKELVKVFNYFELNFNENDVIYIYNQ